MSERVRRALVTGSSGGIGEATAHRLAQLGIAVAVHGRRTEAVHRVVREIEAAGGRAVPVLGDLVNEEAVARVATEAAAALGGIDLLVNNAAQLSFGALEETSLEEIRRSFELNVVAVIGLTNAFLPAMRQQGFGRIINVSSMVGWMPFPFMGPYAMTKHAIEGYSETLDHEIRHLGVRVSTVQPGYTRTNINTNAGMVERTISQYDRTRKHIERLVADQIERGTKPEAVARVIARAALDRRPKLHYPVGFKTAFLLALRSFLPDALFSVGLRFHFGLDRLAATARREGKHG